MEITVEAFDGAHVIDIFDIDISTQSAIEKMIKGIEPVKGGN